MGRHQSVAWYIGLRYTRAKKRKGFISFISLVSMLGIALGVMVLITVLSVMNGFDSKIKQKFFSMVPPVTISFPAKQIGNWQQYNKLIAGQGAVTAISPYISSNIMLSENGQFKGVNMLGILPDKTHAIKTIAKHMQAGSPTSLTPNSFHLLMGKSLALSLGLGVGDHVTVLIPQVTSTPMGIFPRYKRFILTGIFHADTGFGFDSSVVFVNMQDAQRLFAHAQANYGLHIQLKNIYQAPAFSQALSKQLPNTWFISNWTQSAGAFFKAIGMEKTMMFMILLLIIMVAVFNLIASLVMVVNEKQADIAILRTIGATPSLIMRIFMIQGTTIGFIGTLLGIALGVILSLNVTELANILQHALGVQLISSSIYFVDYLPSQLQGGDIVRVGLMALLLSFLATLYPAWTAFKTQPAEALRYE